MPFGKNKYIFHISHTFFPDGLLPRIIFIVCLFYKFSCLSRVQWAAMEKARALCGLPLGPVLSPLFTDGVTLDTSSTSRRFSFPAFNGPITDVLSGADGQSHVSPWLGYAPVV